MENPPQMSKLKQGEVKMTHGSQEPPLPPSSPEQKPECCLCGLITSGSHVQHPILRMALPALYLKPSGLGGGGFSELLGVSSSSPLSEVVLLRVVPSAGSTSWVK